MNGRLSTTSSIRTSARLGSFLLNMASTRLLRLLQPREDAIGQRLGLVCREVIDNGERDVVGAVVPEIEQRAIAVLCQLTLEPRFRDRAVSCSFSSATGDALTVSSSTPC